MDSVRTYKAMDYHMKLYGFWPADLAAVVLVFVVVHTLENSFLADIVTLGPAVMVAWRSRNRPPRYLTSLISFCVTPTEHGVGLTRERNFRWKA